MSQSSDMILFSFTIGLLSASCGVLMVRSHGMAPLQPLYPIHASHQDSPYFRPTHDPLPRLLMDEASLTVSSRVDRPLTLAAQSDVCYDCPLLNITNVHPQSNRTLIVDTRFTSTLRILLRLNESFEESVCLKRFKFEEHGRYYLWVNPNRTSQINEPMCNFYLENNPASSNLPIFVALGFFLFCVLIFCLLKSFYRCGLFNRCIFWTSPSDSETLINSDLGSPVSVDESGSPSPESVNPVRSTRLKSLDTFRGISLVIMIFVNYRGGGYWFFRHSAWNGLTLADLVFPWFVFIMGTSMALSFRGALRRGIPRFKLILKVLKRAMILFALGVMISNSKGKAVDLRTLRVPGVLQRLALTYLVLGIMEAALAKSHDPHQHKWWSSVRDVVGNLGQWAAVLMFVAVHCCLTFLLPVPGCPKGYLGPGGLQHGGAYENCTGGATAYIDRMIFGTEHMYGHPTCMIPYQTTVPLDPEGVLGTLTSIFLCFLGLQAGKVILIFQGWKSRVSRWMCWSLVTGLVAGCLCKFSAEDGFIPINKNLWSLSYVMALASMAFLLLSVCFLAVDIFRVWSGAPFIYPGMNSIVIYLLHEILHWYFPVQFKVGETHAEQLAMNLWGACLWVGVAFMLHQHKVFISI